MHTSSDENIRVPCENASLLRNNRWHVHFKEPPCRYCTVVKQAPEQRVESGRCSAQVACDGAQVACDGAAHKWRVQMEVRARDSGRVRWESDVFQQCSVVEDVRAQDSQWMMRTHPAPRLTT
jgi:hypothetical protein